MCRVSPGIFFFVPENNVNLQSILMGRGIGHTQFEAVYTQYYARFVIIARRYVRDVAVAEDIVMESFASFWENRERIALETNLPAYVATSVRNNCLNWLNAQTLHLAKLHDIHSLQTRNIVASIRSLNACDPQRLFTDEIRAIVECEMLTMPQVTRQVFELSRFCGKTYAEIAEALVSHSAASRPKCSALSPS